MQPHESSGVRPSTVPVSINLLFIKEVLITINIYTVLTMKVKVTQSCLTLCDPMDYTVNGIYSPGQNTGVSSLSLLQGIFPTQGPNPGIPHCIWILYQLNHKGSPRTLEQVAYPFSSGSSWPRDRTRVSCITGRFFTNWAIREAHTYYKPNTNLSALYKAT